ncbi:hypothetical protein Kuja_1180 [Vibrio phage vB_VchM_Kuja]|uniref:Head completion nuclease n=1 Tax=Vibrio phage vB_VchM_Kuja TaxID=2686437 RepID=A0A6B9J9G7_9CAUD|nr:head closure [Vibrio phage vB_VchM_Kuja]QGZ16109.1 hypothetical protein Kuja_1180 [Vibrio phage vB_VchM_Kuja]
MAYNYFQGYYHPKNPQKYEFPSGPKKIYPYHRSGLEFSAFKWCDTNSNVISWSNERVVIPYISPVDGKRHNYFMDLKITVKTSETTVKTVLVEIKPIAQTKEPQRRGRPETYLEACRTYAVNKAKWAAAEAYAKSQGFGFIIWTEHELIEGYQNDAELKQRMREHQKKVRQEKEMNNVRRQRARAMAKALKDRIKSDINIS